MPMDSVICRRLLDESRGNTFICACPMCEQQRKEVNLLNPDEPLGMAGEEISSPGLLGKVGQK